MIRIKLQDGRKIDLELYEDVAPITVKNFYKLIDQHYFDGVIFHRVIEGFMIQTGAYYIDEATLKEKDKVEEIIGEFKQNGIENNLLHKAGIISMARTNVMNSASSQFFICAVDCPHLDGAYAAFGKVVDEESMQVVLDISKVPTTTFYHFHDFPVEPVIISEVVRID